MTRKEYSRPMPTTGVLCRVKEHQDFDPAFAFFLLLNATLILRPAELVPALAGAPIYEVLILAACVLAHRRIIGQFSWKALQSQPVTLCVLGLLGAAVLSHLTHMYLAGAQESAILLLKTLVYFLLFIAVVDTPDRLRAFLLAVALAASALVMLCVVDYWGWCDVPFINHIVEHEGVTLTNEAQRIERMRGAGIFSDPNDISLLIVAAGVLCSYFLTDRRIGTLRFAWIVPIGILLAGLYSTHSRGGLLAAGAAGLILVLCRFGWKQALMVALLGVAMLPLVRGRQGSIDLDSGTGHQRILLWRDGFVAIESPDLLFGIGLGLYPDVAGLVAHNSFIHAYVELGLFGGTLFFGCFFFSGLALFRMRHLRHRLHDRELARMYPFMAALLAGWCAGMMSLSRCYMVPTYLVAATAAVYVGLAGRRLRSLRTLVRWNQEGLFRLAGSSAALFLFLFVFTVTFANS